MKIKEVLKKYPMLIVFAGLLVGVWIVYGIYIFFYNRGNNDSQAAFDDLTQNAFVSTSDNSSVSSEKVNDTVEVEEGPSEEELRAIERANWEKRLGEFYANCGNEDYYREYVDNVPDFQVLYGYNDDIVAYLLIPDTKISYPVLQSAEDGFYLDHNLDKKKGHTGCLYIENFNDADMHDPIAVIYGHDMLNDSMFGTLNKYLDGGYRKKNKYFFIYTPNEVQIYEVAITSVVEDVHLYKITEDFIQQDEDTLVFKEFRGDEPVILYNAFINKSINHSNTYITDVPFTEEDQLMVMSTCFRTGTRFIVVGRRVV